MGKLYEAEKIFKRFICKNLPLLLIIAFILIKLYVCYQSRAFATQDYTIFLKEWIDYIKEHGGLIALKDEFANYSAPYLTILTVISSLPIKALYGIKIVSIIFDFLLAFSVQLLIGEFTSGKTRQKIVRLLSFGIVLLLPTVSLNSAVWGQCESIYATFVILSLYMLTRRKNFASFIFFGVALAFKLQAIFILPIFVIAYLKRENISLMHFLTIPASMIMLSLPALIAGMPFSRIFSVYFQQASYYKILSANMYNLWAFIPGNYDMFSPIALSLTALILIVIASLFITSGRKLDRVTILDLTLASILVCVFFLPAMHERYAYLADIISIIWAFAHLTRRKGKLRLFIIPVACEIGSLLSYAPYLTRSSHEYQMISGCMLFAFATSYMVYRVISPSIALLRNKRPTTA